jgi:hypothetical protein
VITEVPGLRVGHATDAAGLTGVTVVLCDRPAVCGVERRGNANDVEGLDYLAAGHLVPTVNGVVLGGGSRFGGEAIWGVMRFLEERGVGYPVGPTVIPHVPGAFIFDLGVGDSRARPTREMGYAAAGAAAAGAVAEGSVGAGTGASVGKLHLVARAMRGGIGTASVRVGDVVVGALVASKIGPSFVYNTVDHPIFPTSGKRYTMSLDFAGIGGNPNFCNPRAESVRYFPIGARRRTSLGFRAQAEYISPYGSTVELPIFEKLFLGGEYSMRGFDLRTVGPRDQTTGLVVGGNKSLLFNVEYLISIAGPVRLILFYDAGQVRDRGESFGWKEPVTQTTLPGALIPYSNDLYQVLNPFTTEFDPLTTVIGERSAFKTSTGAEIRFFMPVLNVPFRLIFAANPSRGGVLDNNLQPEKKWKFRFAVGSTF